MLLQFDIIKTKLSSNNLLLCMFLSWPELSLSPSIQFNWMDNNHWHFYSFTDVIKWWHCVLVGNTSSELLEFTKYFMCIFVLFVCPACQFLKSVLYYLFKRTVYLRGTKIFLQQKVWEKKKNDGYCQTFHLNPFYIIHS